MNLIHRVISSVGQTMRTRVRRRLVRRWHANDGDHTLRVNYPLTHDSVVLDIGGYQGDWSDLIWNRFRPTIHIFEPIPTNAEAIAQRFADVDKMTVHRFGLADRNGQTSISIRDDASSIVRTVGPTTNIQLRAASEVFDALRLQHVDLAKINIEGAEYDLLNHLLDSGMIERIAHLQIQFHDFVDDATQRMEKIQRRLSQTHRLTWQYRFVWENWTRQP